MDMLRPMLMFATSLLTVAASIPCGSAVERGAADYLPTPEHPIGHRAAGQGWFRGATPPIEWWEGTPVMREVGSRGGRFGDYKPKEMWDTADDRSKNILWKAPLGGWGYSTPIVVGKRIYTTGHPYWVSCYDADAGELLWKRAMTPMVANGMAAEEAEKVRKVYDLAWALRMVDNAAKKGNTLFLRQAAHREEMKHPEEAKRKRLATLENALALLARHRGDVEALANDAITAALDEDVAMLTALVEKTRATAPAEFNKVFKYGRGKIALMDAIRTTYDVSFGQCWDGYVSCADSTLASDGERIYGVFSHGQVFAYDLDGNLVWARNESGARAYTRYNFHRSPLLRDGVLIYRDEPRHKGHKARWRACDPATGELLWEHEESCDLAWTIPLAVDLTAPDGTVVPVIITTGGQGDAKRDKENYKGQSVIRIRDGKVLGTLPVHDGDDVFFTGCGAQMTWHSLAGTEHATPWDGGGILVCWPTADNPGTGWGFKVWLSDAETVEAKPWWNGKRENLVHKSQMFPVNLGRYLTTGSRFCGIVDPIAKRRVADLPVARGDLKYTSTRVGNSLIGQSVAPGNVGTRGRLTREDGKGLSAFAVVDVADPTRPRLLSNRNVLGNALPPADHIIADYLDPWKPWNIRLHLTGTYYSAASHFGTDQSGIVGHGDRLYIQGNVYLYCIGPAVNGTASDDPQVVATIRAAKDLAALKPYLAHASAQYRYEALKRVAALAVPIEGIADELGALARDDIYEEIRAAALRLLGLEAGQAGATMLREMILDEVTIPRNRSRMATPSNDAVMTVRALGRDADVTLAAMLAAEDLAVRQAAAATVLVIAPSGAQLRDALLACHSAVKDVRGQEQYLEVACAQALAAWPQDATIMAAFTALNTEGAGDSQEPVFRYLLAHQQSADDRIALLRAAVTSGHNGKPNLAIPHLVKAEAIEVLRDTVSTLEGGALVGAIGALAAAADEYRKPGAGALAVRLLQKHLPNTDDSRALGGLLGACRELKAAAAPLLPLIKALDAGEDKKLKHAIGRTIAAIEKAIDR